MLIHKINFVFVRFSKMSRRIKPQSVALQPRNVFHRRTCGLTLPPDHDVYDDQDCYHEFDDIFRELSPARGQFRQSDHAVWYSKTLLFKNFQQSLYQVGISKFLIIYYVFFVWYRMKLVYLQQLIVNT